ncbi:hypothetical protein HNQ94_001049 [Salirhabdus euzebyi]|uniref:NERD domain-containing protein n=1 Tax=Salirhabdus euzebyi TaxID=394506 RepID=A0A841Q226_9BACI|nr:nuclease-related domain-containing protein [Salirhabdus euzebyi]MBB6452603.1 hypothetical protein [Salirhabdus euzebyi]
MANIHEGENQLKAQANKSLTLAIFFLAFPAIYFLVFSQGFHFDGFFHLVPILLGGIGVHFLHRFQALRSGIKGESRTANVLRGLPDGYEVFSSVSLSTKEGTAEYDHIIAGENGLFVVEVKNHNGTIKGSEEEHSWTQHKVGQKGGQYSKQMRNPVKQVRRQVYILSNHLKENGVNVWIEGVVFFSNPKTKVHVRTEKTPVFHSPEQLSHYLNTYVPKRKADNVVLEKVKSLLLK